jgi:hypothetical protein
MKNAVEKILEEDKEPKLRLVPKPEKQPKPKVAYERTEDGFYLMTVDARATEILAARGIKFRVQMKPYKYYVGVVKKLVRYPGIFYYAHKVAPPTEVDQREVERLNAARLAAYEELENKTRQLNEKYSRAVDALYAGLQEIGLKLKPGLPLDSQLWDREAEHRLHLRQSLKTFINQEAVEELAQKYPILKGAFKTAKVVQLDKEELAKILPQLPANVASLIVTWKPITSFNTETPIKPECSYCGGRLLKSGRCHHCGLSGISD